MKKRSLTYCTSVAALVFLITASVGCGVSSNTADLGRIYNRSAQSSDIDRNPVIVIPGILGSKLRDGPGGQLVWGAFGGEFANPQNADGARLISIPMSMGTSPAGLVDGVQPDGVLDSLKVTIAGLPITLDAYRNILSSLGVGGYRDESLGESGNVDYGDEHFTCFQFDYDWRRDNVENAKRLHRFILEKKAYIRREFLKRHGVDREDLKFDIVAHSMGGLITRYYLRYGDKDLDDGDIPQPITWAGAEHVERAILVGTPNGGAVAAFRQMVDGVKFAPILPKYEPAILGTMPSMYQLLPRGRHGLVVGADGDPIANLTSPNLWREMDWGLAAKDQEGVIEQLLPLIADKAERRKVALDHQSKLLRRAEKFHRALDITAAPPKGLQLYLLAGDAELTASKAMAHKDGSVSITQTAPGDGSVTRASALMDERLDGVWSTTLRTPINWAGVQFIFADHLGLTKNAAFTDNLLYLLLEAPRP